MRSRSDTVRSVSKERRLFFLLAQAQRALARRADAALLAEHGVTSAQAAALMFLAKNDASALTRLADGLALNAPAVTGLANRLEKLGLVERKDDPDDGRSYRLTLTAEGRARAAAIVPRVRALQTELTRGFSADEMDVVVRFLGSLVTRFQETP
jgi:DNA-binding MarR family transcriptional regulator